MKYASKIVPSLEPEFACRHLLQLSSFHTVFLSRSYLNAKNISSLCLLTADLLTKSLKLLGPSNVQPVILFLGQFIQFWKGHPLYLSRICFLIHKILDSFASQAPILAEAPMMAQVVDQVLLLILRLLEYVLASIPLVQRVEEASERPSHFGNPFRKGDQSGRDAALFQGQRLTCCNSVYEIGDELMVGKSLQLVSVTLWNCQLLRLVCTLSVRFEKEAIPEETLMRISDCVLCVFRIVSRYKQPLVTSLTQESKINALLDDTLKEVATGLLTFSCSQLTFIINRIAPVFVDLLLENRYLENILPYFSMPMAQTLISYYVLQEVSNRFNVGLILSCEDRSWRWMARKPRCWFISSSGRFCTPT